jgi:hypothetical protein
MKLALAAEVIVAIGRIHNDTIWTQGKGLLGYCGCEIREETVTAHSRRFLTSHPRHVMNNQFFPLSA